MKIVRTTQESPPKPSVLERFQTKFGLPDRPGAGIPDLPLNLDDLSDANLMRVYVEYVAWASYTKAQCVLAELEEEKQLDRLESMSAVKLLSASMEPSKGDTVTLQKARRDSDPAYIAQKDEHRQARAYRKLVDTVFDRCERSASLLSRELSRRISQTQPASTQRYAP